MRCDATIKASSDNNDDNEGSEKITKATANKNSQRTADVLADFCAVIARLLTLLNLIGMAHAIVALISKIAVSSKGIVATSISSQLRIQAIVYFCPVLMDSLGDCLSVTENTRCYGLIVVAAQYSVQYFCFQHLKNVEGVELPSFDDLVKLKHDPGLSSVKRTILGAGHYSEHIARWMRYYNAKQVSPVYM